MVTSIPAETRKRSIEYQRDFYKSELLSMGYFKTPDKRQLYELSLDELKSIYHSQKRKGECSDNV